MRSFLLGRLIRFSGCLLVAATAGLWSGCEGGGGGTSHDFGDNDPAKVVCLGDSITGDMNYDGVAPYPSELAHMRSDKTVINKGKGGQSSGGGASRIGGILKEKPGYVCILYGANDVINGYPKSETISNLRAIISNCKMNKTVPILATCTPTSGSRWIFDGAIKQLNAQIRQLAGDEGIQLVDLENEFAGSESARFPDGLHPDAAGCAIIAAAFSDQIN